MHVKERAEMADETTTVDETTTTTGGTEPQAGKDGTPFDAQRAQATIDALRNEIKAGKATAKEAEALKARLKEIEDKDKSEVERLAGSAKEASEKLTASEKRARDLAIRLAVAETATSIGISGASVKAAVRLLDHGALTFDEDTGDVEATEGARDAGRCSGKKAEKGTPALPKQRRPEPRGYRTGASETRRERQLSAILS
jgi:type I site-specific restriction endonuclease